MTAKKAAPKAGRPTLYDKAYAAQAKKLCAMGATDREVAEFFEVSERTLYRWQAEHPELCQALKVGKESPDDRVERSLYRRAVGYSFDSVKIMQFQGHEVVIPYVEHVPPDTTAAIFWLKNRRPTEWRDRQELTGAEGKPLISAEVSDKALLARVVMMLAKAAATEDTRTGD